MRKFIGLGLIMAVASAAFAGENGFLFITTRGQNTPAEEQIYFALSKDGMQWESLNADQPALISTVGEKGARDPYLIRSENGHFFLLATNLSISTNRNWQRATERGSRSLVIWESSDLVNWSEPRLAEVAPPEAGCAWSPEAIYDPAQQKYLVYWSSTTKADHFKKQRIYAAWTRDFQSFSTSFPYLEGTSHMSDLDIVHGDDGKYYRFYRDDSVRAIAMESSDSITGNWLPVPGFSLSDPKYGGPCCFLVKPAESGEPPAWCLFLNDGSKVEKYIPFITDKLSSANFIPGPGFSFPFPFHQGSVLPLKEGEYEALKARWP